MLFNCFAVGLGGFLGAAARYALGLIPLKETTVFPIKTFCINLLGCLVIGLLAAVSAKDHALDPRWMLFLKVGLCGGFTTFSTFALESGDLLRGGHTWIALAYVLLSVVLGIGLILFVQSRT